MFLGTSGFFTTWDGRAVSSRGLRSEEAPSIDVLVVDSSDSSERELSWPADLVRALELPIDPLAIAPVELPAGLPITKKQRFSLSFHVSHEVEGKTEVSSASTASPRTLGIATLVFIIGVFLRNMFWSGSPFTITRGQIYLPAAQAAAGQAAKGPSNKGGRSKKGPPPRSRGKRGKRPR